MASHIRSLCFAGFLAIAGAASAGNLIECPDCDEMVSYRALLCPHCGCPGDAIKEAAAALKAEAEGPAALPLAQLTADHGPQGCRIGKILPPDGRGAAGRMSCALVIPRFRTPPWVTGLFGRTRIPTRTLESVNDANEVTG